MSNQIASLFVAISAKTSEFHKGMDGVSNKMNQVSKQMQIAGGIIVGTMAAIGAGSLKIAGDFDGAMREVNTMILLSEDEFKAFSHDVQTLAKEMGVNAVDAANALYQAISAGVPKENAIEFLRIATKAAIAGVTDTTTAVDGLTTIINAYKLPISEAQKISDIMFTTVKGGKTTFEELSASMSQAMPTAAALGVGYEEVLAAVASMTKQGIPTAQAFTQIRQTMVALIKPTTDMASVIQELGYESGEAMFQSLGFAGTLETLREATGDNNEMLGKMFGSVEAINAVMALTGENFKTATDDLNAMTNSASATTDAFNQMEKSMGRQWEKLGAQFQDIAITLGTALMPALKKILDVITPIIKKIGEWISEHSDLTVKILATVTALGGVMLLAGPLLNTIKLIIGAFGTLKIAMIAIKNHATLMWGALTLGISAVVIGIVELIRNWDDVVAFFRGPAYQATLALKKAMNDLGDTMLEDIGYAVEQVKADFQSLIDSLQAGEFTAFENLNEEKIGKILDKVKEVNPELADQLETLLAQIKVQDELIEGYDETARAARIAAIEARLEEPELVEEEELQLLEELADLQKKTYVSDLHSLLDENKNIIVGAIGELKTEWEEYFQAINDGWDGSKDYLENTIIPAYNKLVTEGFLSPTVAEDLIKQFEDAVEDYETRISKIPEIERGFPTIPGLPTPWWKNLQFGGIVKSPTLAMVGESGPEAVIPLNQLGSEVGKRVEIHNHFGVFVGDEIGLRKLYRMMMKQVGGEEARRTQFGPIRGGDYFDYGRASL